MRKRNTPRENQLISPQERLVFANVTLRSASGKSVLQAGSALTPHTVKRYLPTESSLEQARRLLTELGFEINLVAPTHITIQGPKDVFEKVFEVRLTRKFAPDFQPFRKGDKKQTYYEPDTPAKIPAALTKLIDSVS